MVELELLVTRRTFGAQSYGTGIDQIREQVGLQADSNILPLKFI
jgi:hypothetical protein